jgi:hypothetical protein
MKADSISKLDFSLRNKLVKCYIWSVVLCGAASWKLLKLDLYTWKVLKCAAGEGWRRSVGPGMGSQGAEKYRTYSKTRDWLHVVWELLSETGY